MTSEWWSDAGQSLRESERPLREAGSGQVVRAADLVASIRCRRKAVAGSQQKTVRESCLQSSVPGMPAEGEAVNIFQPVV